jgi:hypothetical protein
MFINMILTKIIGWALLILGILLMVWILFTSYNIFTGRTNPPVVFPVEEEITDSSSEEEILTLSFEQIEKMIENKLGDIFPSEFLSKLLNLIAWSFFAGILIFAGGQISSLGIKLINK